MILFLDFDGVLHQEYIADTAPGAVRSESDFSCLPRFEAVMRDFPQVDIVISSAWRETNSLDALRKLFSSDIANRIVSVTPILPLSIDARREREILAWLSMSGRESETIVAVDDWPALFTPNCSFLFAVDPETALDDTAAEALRQRLRTLVLE